MKKILLLVLSMYNTIVLFGCNNVVPSEGELSSFQQENENLKVKIIDLEEEIFTYNKKWLNLNNDKNLQHLIQK